MNYFEHTVDATNGHVTVGHDVEGNISVWAYVEGNISVWAYEEYGDVPDVLTPEQAIELGELLIKLGREALNHQEVSHASSTL